MSYPKISLVDNEQIQQILPFIQEVRAEIAPMYFSLTPAEACRALELKVSCLLRDQMSYSFLDTQQIFEQFSLDEVKRREDLLDFCALMAVLDSLNE